MADQKVASLEGGLVSSASDIAGDAGAGGGTKVNLAEDEPKKPADEDIYETDEAGNVLLDASGNPIRLPPPIDVEPLFKSLTRSYPPAVGKALSRKERISKDLTSTSLAYGEVTFSLMESVISALKELGLLKRKQGKFFDLGSGLGKAVILAAMLYPFKTCVGIEVLEQLHKASTELLQEFRSKVAGKLHFLPGVGLVLGDVAEVLDWRSASVLFINMTTFPEEMIEEIKQRAGGMKRGTVCVTVTKQFRSKAWEVIHTLEEDLNWGKSHVYIHRKVM